MSVQVASSHDPYGSSVASGLLSLVTETHRTPKSGEPPPHRRRGHLSRQTSLIRLVGVELAEQYDESIEARRYLSLEMIQQSPTIGTTPSNENETTIDRARSA